MVLVETVFGAVCGFLGCNEKSTWKMDFMLCSVDADNTVSLYSEMDVMSNK